MTAPHIVDPFGLLGDALAQASPDLMRNLLRGGHSAAKRRWTKRHN